MNKRNILVEGIVIKRNDSGETDRLVTLISQQMGKITCVAKGIRKLNSSMRSTLEPGNVIKAYLVITRGMPLLVQAKLIQDASALRSQLCHIRQLTQILEILDKLFVEEEMPSSTYQLLLAIHHNLLNHQTKFIRRDILILLEKLGFSTAGSQRPQSLLEYVQEIAERPMHSFDFLSVQ